jgi:Tfp pilus assembly protein PilO
MTMRDRLVVIGILLVVVLAGGWLMIVKPERNKASQLEAEVLTAQGQLSSAQGKLAQAREAQARYRVAYAAIVRMGKAVPAGQEVPALVYQLDRASQSKHVSFESISTSSSSSSSAASVGAASGFSQLPFTFAFSGSFADLSRLLARLDNFTSSTRSGALLVNGRLLTIQSVNLTPQTSSSGQGHSAAATLSGTITATAYTLPVGQGLTAGAGSGGPASAAQPVSSAGSSSSSTTPAVVEAHP